MCGRYRIEDTERFRSIIEEMMKSPLVDVWKKISEIKTLGEICPTDIVPVIAMNRRGEKAVFPMKWGFTGRQLRINARVETASEKESFRNEWLTHRCIIPASYYFEWSHMIGKDGKKKAVDKYSIQPKGSDMTWLCGLYRFENDLPVYVILTREPGQEVSAIHDRMPLILPEDFVSRWIRPDENPDELLECALTEMVLEKCGSDN